jgi:hypothetical protein
MAQDFPSPPDPIEQFSNPSPPPPAKKNNTVWIIVAVVAVLLACCCLIGLGVVLYNNFDNWFGPMMNTLPALPQVV